MARSACEYWSVRDTTAGCCEVELLQSATKDGQCCQSEARTALQGREVEPLPSLVVASLHLFSYLTLLSARQDL